MNRDHVIPVIYQRGDRKRQFGIDGPTTWACRECNNRLAARMFDTFQDRCRWRQERLAKIAKPVEWHIWEIAQLGDGLREYVLQDRNRRIWQAQRAEWFESREYWINLENLQWQLADLPNSAGKRYLTSYFDSTVSMIKSVMYSVKH